LRKITEIILKDWMSHKHTVINPARHINVITGTSDAGKSAIYRAMEYAYHMGKEGYRQFHPGWVHYDASYATIIIKYDDGHVFERVKGEKKNEVRLYLNDELIYEKLKVGTEYDKEIVDFLGDPPFEKPLGSFSFSNQHDSAFLVSQSENAIPKIISKLSNSGDYDRATEVLKDEITSLNPLIKASENKIKEIKNNLVEFDNLDDLISKYELLKTEIDVADALQSEINNIEFLVNNARNKKKDSDELIDLNKYDSEILSVIGNLDDLQTLVDEINSLTSVFNDLENKEKQIVDLNTENVQAEYFISEECVDAIATMDDCVRIIKELESFHNQLTDLDKTIEDAESLLSNDQDRLKEYDDEIDSLETENKEYEDYLRINQLCPVCGK
jgi:exonuclease SbcC